MKYTQNAKIMQITENTLVIGVDVASEIHYARAFDFRGIEYGRLLKFSNDGDGFTAFVEWIEKLRAENNTTKIM
jgi:transposase